MSEPDTVYVVTLRATTELQRRLFFDCPRGAQGEAAYRRVRKRAEQMSSEFADLVEATSALRAYAAEHGLRGIAH